MNIYHVWCDLKPGVGDLMFSEKVGTYLGHLKEQGLITNAEYEKKRGEILKTV